MLATKPFFFLFTLFFASFFSVANSAINLEQLPIYSKIFDDTRDPSMDARAAIKLARETNRHVLIEVGGNWCTWCHKMDDFFAKNPEVYQELHNTFVLLKVNVSDSNENEQFMAAMPPVLGYPHMYVSTNKGKLVLSKDTADFLANGTYNREKFMAFFNQWQNNTKQVAQVQEAK